MTEQFANNVVTTLNGAITGGATSLVLASATGVPTSGTFRLLIDSELLTVSAVSGTTLTVARGAEGTTAASHLTGATVTLVLTAAALAQFKADILAAVPASDTALLTTKGDLLTRTTSAAARLPVGADGTALVADSTQTSGLRYALLVSNPMTTKGDTLVGAPTATSNQALTSISGVAATTSGWTPSLGTATSAIDGNDTTYVGNFSSIGAGAIVAVDLASVKTIASYRVLFLQGGSAQFKIQSSPDNTTWTDQAVNVSGAVDTGEIALATPLAARYWRLLTTTTASGGLALFSLEFRSGTPPGTPARLAAGTNGQVPTYDSTATNGITPKNPDPALATHAATSKTTPVDADELPLVDSAASNVLKKLTWANLKATAKAYFDTLYAAVTHTHAAADLTSGTIAPARLGSGTADSTTYLRGDQTWATVSGGSSGAWTKISETALAVATATVTFSSLPQTYRALWIVLSGAQSGANFEDNVMLRLNGDTGNNYDFAYQFVNYQSGGATGGLGVAATAYLLFNVPGTSSPSAASGQGEVFLIDYTTTAFRKNVIWRAAQQRDNSNTVTGRFWNGSGDWRATAAITSLSLYIAGGANWVAGSTFSLYGLS